MFTEMIGKGFFILKGSEKHVHNIFILSVSVVSFQDLEE